MSYHHKSGAQKRREKAMRAEGGQRAEYAKTTWVCRGGHRIFQKGGLRPAIRNAGGGGGGGGGGVRFRPDTTSVGGGGGGAVRRFRPDTKAGGAV